MQKKTAPAKAAKTTLDPETLKAIAAIKEFTDTLIGASQSLQSSIGNILIGQDVEAVIPPTKPAKADKAAPTPKRKAQPEPDDDEDDDSDDDERTARQEELEGMSIAALRKVAMKLDFAKEDVQDADAETLIENILDAEFGDDDEEDEDEADDDDTDDEEDEDEADDDDTDDEEDEDDDEAGYTADDLQGMSLAALRKVAKDEYGVAAGDLKGLDKDGIVDLLLGDDDTDDEDEDEDFDGYDEDDLAEMSLAELKDIANEWGLKVKPGSKSPTYVKAILAAQDDDEDDED
jgi:hypothetical protein